MRTIYDGLLELEVLEILIFVLYMMALLAKKKNIYVLDFHFYIAQNQHKFMTCGIIYIEYPDTTLIRHTKMDVDSLDFLFKLKMREKQKIDSTKENILLTNKSTK